MIDLKYLAFGLAGAGLLGVIVHLAFGIDLLASLLVAVGGVIINGVIASLGDRGKFNDYREPAVEQSL